MINFDLLIKDEYKLKYTNSNPMTVQHPARCLIIGGSGCGKTNLLLNLLLNKEMKMDYNRVYVIAKNTTEDKYKYLQDYYREIEDKVSELTESKTEIFTMIDNLDDAPDLDEDIDDLNQNILIFDDVVTSKNQDVMTEYWIRSRKMNCTVFYLVPVIFQSPENY